MNLELVGALNELEKERGISKEILREAIEAAIVTAYKRNHAAQSVRVELDDRTGRIQVFAQKEVVETVEDDATEISLEEARRIDPSYEEGDIVEVEVTPRDFGRIAAQTAKQVVIQRIREAERTLIYEEFASKEGDIVTGIVQRSDGRVVHIDLGKIEATLLPMEQIPGETYQHGDRIKVYITEVRRTTKGPQVHISRTHPGLVKRLFELEVPEIHQGIVEVKGLAREPGQRTKIAVASKDPHVDPVGACVGPRGVRVQAVVNELKGEKIDIIAWDPDPRRYVGNALSPAKVVATYVNPDDMTARAVVPDHQLSLAIGREGQNARLAARLTGWKIDIKSESQQAELAVLEAQRAFDEAEAALRAREEARARAEAEELEDAVHEEELEVVAVSPQADDAFDEVEPADDVFDDEAVPAPAEELPGVDDEAEWAEDDGFTDESYDDEAWDDDGYAEDDDELYGDEDDVWADEDDSALLEELLLADDDDDAIEPAPAPAPPRRMSRAAKKAEMMALLEEGFLDDEDEPLPSLFGEDLDDDEAAGVDPGLPRRVAGVGRGGGKSADKQRDRKGKGKRVLKDLSALSDLSDDL